MRFISFLILVLAHIVPWSAVADWHFVSPGKDRQARGTLSTVKKKNQTYVSVKQFCYALGCQTLYQWPQHRVIIQNRQERLSAIVSSLTHVALVDGKIVDFEGVILSHGGEGYLLPIDLASKLAVSLQLGYIEEKQAPSLAASKAPQNKKTSNSVSMAEPKPAQALSVIVLDPGHGGNDWGTGFGSIHEKDVAVIYGLKLRDEIKRQMPGVEVFLTREEDRYVSLPDRAKFANSKGANLFLSLHVNHAPSASIEGVETYILSTEATDKDARKLALLENESWLKSSGIKDSNDAVTKILIDMEQTKYIQDSALVAALIQQELSTLDSRFGLKNRGVKQAMFYVLSQVAMPSALVEIGFLSSTGDRGRLMDVNFRDDFVKGVVQALKRYSEKSALKEVY
ncbi:MAG: N-acetylmuramoyl-L-alanine amidase [Bdellovibrionota bacterium]